MTNALILTRLKGLDEIHDGINARVDGCSTDGCWVIKDPKTTNRNLWLPAKFVSAPSGQKQKARLTSIKRVLYCLDREEVVPKKNIKNVCRNVWCCNPSHLYIPGYTPSDEHIRHWIEKDPAYLKKEDAVKWWTLKK